MKKVWHKYKPFLSDRRYMISFFVGAALLVLSLVVNFYAGIYATERAGNSVQDLILSNIPVFNVDFLFVYGPAVMWLFTIWLGLRNPKKFPFALKSIALFVVIRSIFITLTHVGPFPGAATIDHTSILIHRFAFGGDLFFSAHTGLPFLMAWVFSDSRPLFWFYSALAVFFGIVVLLGHLHYSIDVLSAFFITYTIYHMAMSLFPKDWKLAFGK